MALALEDTLREISAGLQSARRKKSAERLNEYLNMEHFQSLLTTNTLTNNHHYSWNDVFHDIHAYILKETEKCESKTFEKTTAPLASTILNLCVARANKGRAYIKCDIITEACLMILKDSRLKMAIGDAYLKLLSKHVLSQEYYLRSITTATWEDLLNVSLSACSSKYSKLDSYAKLRLVLLVMKNAKHYTQFIIPLRDALPKWNKCILKTAQDKKAQEVIVEIIVLLLETLSAECRLSVCHFMEGILPILIQYKFYDQNMDLKKKCLLFQLLHYNVVLHHPLGRTRNQEGSLADDWDIWNRHLNSILEIISIEVSALQKIRKPTEELLKQYECFYKLSAAVYFQAFALAESTENEVESVPKRQKLTCNEKKTFSDLIDELRQNNIPWLGIIHEYVNNNASSISIDDYVNLMNVIQNLLTSNAVLTWDVVEELTCAVLKQLASYIAGRKDDCESVIVSVWNHHVRNSTTSNTSHRTSHKIIQCILTLDVVDYQNTISLFKFYTEKSMPVTNDSAMTLRTLFHKFFSKYSHDDIRSDCFSWLIQGDITSVDIPCVKELIMCLISNENINLPTPMVVSQNKLYDTLYNSNEKCNLFNLFELELDKSHSAVHNTKEEFEKISEIEKQMSDYFKMKLLNGPTDNVSDIKNIHTSLIEYMKLINIIIVYLDIALRENSEGQLEPFQNTLKHMYVFVENALKCEEQIQLKIKILNTLKDILLTDVGIEMSTEIRSHIHGELLDLIKRNMLIKVKADDEEIVYASDEKDVNEKTLKHNCIMVLAAYCTKNSDRREAILKFILCHKSYDFEVDAPCLFRCIELLTDARVHDPPIKLIFNLMQDMCRALYKDPVISFELIKNVLKMLDTVWCPDNNLSVTKQNCLIMLKSYVSLCGKQHYPVNVAALIYECIARTAHLNRKYNLEVDEAFESALMGKIKGNIHSLRIYCCYLLKLFIKECPQDDIELLLSELSEIFRIDVAEGQQQFLKDELSNRTLTVLHCYLALAQTKNVLIHQLVTGILKLQKQKCLDKTLVKKVLKEIGNSAGVSNFENYVKKNIVSIIFFWFSNNYSIEDLPVHLFGTISLDNFKEQHKNWLIPADIIWLKSGNVNDCDFLKQIKENQSAKDMIESSFLNIVVLCLPYIVTEKYGLNYKGSESFEQFKKSSASAQKLFKHTSQILEHGKWSSLFVENVGKLVLMTAMHICDRREAKKMFGVDVPEEIKPYGYPVAVFSAILNCFEEITRKNIMQYLCQKQPMAIFQVLFSIWKMVLDENVIEFKVMALHAFIAFFQIIPMSQPTDAFVCNFVCNSFSRGIRDSRKPDELRAFAIGMRIVIEKLLHSKIEVVQKSVSQLIPILIMRKEEHEACSSLLEYLTVDMKSYLSPSEDVVDFIHILSQPDRGDGAVDYSCSTKMNFTEKVKAQISNLKCPSSDILSKLHRLLKSNRHYVKALYKEINAKGFSEVCGSSVIHQLVYALNNILKSVYYDEKIIIEACNCLSEICTYDLKTLVTVPPPNTRRIVDLDPKHYMACVVLTSLSEVLFDGDPGLTDKVARTLNTLFKFRVGCDALELEQVDKQLLKPLTTPNSNKPKDIRMSSRKFDQYCVEHVEGIFIKALTSYWDPNENKNHSKWLKKVTTTLIQLLDPTSSYLDDLMQVCTLKSSVCRKLLPVLMGSILQCSNEHHLEIISKHINNVFEYIWERTFDDRVENSGDCTRINQRTSALDVGHKMVIQYMLEIVDFVRLQRSYYTTRPGRGVESLNYLRLDYDKVSWAATVADQSLAAIYYGELWAAQHNAGVPPPSPDATAALPGGENLLRIFRKCYICIGELDAIEGCGTAHLTIESEKRSHLVNTGQYADALLLHDIALSSESSAPAALHRGALASLHKSGMYHLALRYINSLPHTEQLDDIKYECMAFLGDWSEIVDTNHLEEKSKLPNSNPVSIIKAFHYACLKDCVSIQNEFKNKLILPINRAKLAISRFSQKLNMENCQSVYQVVSKLHLFSDIEDYALVRTNEMSPRELISKWEVDNLPSSNHFKHMESLISQRVLILEHAAKMHHDLQDEIVSLQIQYAKLGLSNNRVQMSQRLLAIVKKLQNSEELALLESEIAWAKGHKEIALSLLKNIVTNESQDVNLTARSLRQYALWMSETKRDNPRDIIDKYLLKSLNVIGSSNVDTRLKIYHDIAKFADAEYKQVVTYMSSTVYVNKVQCLENMKDTASSLRSTQNLNTDGAKVLRTHERFRALDEDEIRNTQVEKENFLSLAMRYYLLSLKQCEENNLSIFRVISLWLDNPSFEFDSSHYTLYSLLSEVPSRKFIAVLPQLAPRLTTEDNKFAKILRGIIRKCAIEHPHHTLPILFALKNSEKDKGLLGTEPRTLAAQALVGELAAVDGQIAVIVEQMELVCDAIISFANYELKTRDNRIPLSEQIHKLRNLDAIPIPTVSIPVRNDCKYTNFPRLHAFENTFELVGGINCPKKIVCTDSTGNKRILLIKGKDDMRQDAVMQQVFSIVNMLLEKDPVTSRNKLLIRTYKVVPMSKQSGVLEWCVGTVPVGAYLAGSRAAPGAHARYRPQDMPCQTAREKLVECYNARKSNKEKLTVFLKILKEFKPVFHYFFTEHYLDPVTWYERRLAYTKSVATTSMVGYIMGLGDRHVQNILIDKRTAEVIHIDFGIAFDLGKTLPTPETVPFRLTQDIIAGFGSSGVEGIFRGCCEKSMQLMRENAETLLTILEVLLCDPLYNWTVSTAQQNVNSPADISRSESGGGADSGLARRALLAVGSKLGGTEGGAAGGVAVQGQVARLLREAVDPANLCRLFHGWQPYL